MNCTYSIANGTLYIGQPSSDSIIWKGKPDGYQARELLELPDSNQCIILLDRSQESRPRSFQNLIAINCCGDVVWRAELPDISGTDAYVSFSLQNGSLFANSWSCFRVTIDLETGAILAREWTK